MIDFDTRKKVSSAHTLLAASVTVLLVFIGYSVVENGFFIPGPGAGRKVLTAIVLVMGMVSLFASILNQLSENGNQVSHYLPCACLMLGLAFAGAGRLPGFTETETEAFAVMLWGAGLCGSCGREKNHVVIAVYMVFCLISIVISGFSVGALFKIMAIVIFAAGLVWGNIGHVDSLQIALGIVLAVIVPMSGSRNILFFIAALTGAAFTFVSNRRNEIGCTVAVKKDPAGNDDEITGNESEKIVAADDEKKEHESAGVSADHGDSSEVKPEILSWKQKFTNIASALDMKGMRLYAYDAGNSIYYRFNSVSCKLSACSEGDCPDLRSIVDPQDRKIFDAFMTNVLKGSPDEFVRCRVWDDISLRYHENSIKASVLDSECSVFILSVYLIEGFVIRYRSEILSLEYNLQESRRRYSEAADDIRRVFYSCNELLNSFIEKKSEESYSHINAVCRITEMLLKKARSLFDDVNYSDAMIACLADATLLHDVGKIMVPDSILKKQGRLTPEEFEEMKRHTIYGAEIISRMPYVRGEEQTMKYALDIALHHHERIDGRGYPDGLSGEKIPFYVQIVSLADVYEAMTARRVYKETVSHEQAVQAIRNGECGKFSDRIMQCFDASLDELAAIRAELKY